MVSKIKLFENWAEELEVPEYLDPVLKDRMFGDGYSIYADHIQNEINRKPRSKIMSLYKIAQGSNRCNNRANFVSFSNYDFWKSSYDKITVDQKDCKYKLKDFKGIPQVDELSIENSEIRSFKGLRDNIRTTRIKSSYIENLKYLPDNQYEIHIEKSPLLSLWGLKFNNNAHFPNISCSQNYEFNDDTGLNFIFKSNLIYLEKFYSIEYHAETFSKFDYSVERRMSNGIQFNPWHQCYYDPSDVENFDFLFHPFYMNSEKFREKAKTMITDIDLGQLTKQELW